MAGFHDVINQFLVVEGSFQILIDGVEVGIVYLSNVVQLTTSVTYVAVPDVW